MTKFLVYKYLTYFDSSKHKSLDKKHIINFSKAGIDVLRVACQEKCWIQLHRTTEAEISCFSDKR